MTSRENGWSSRYLPTDREKEAGRSRSSLEPEAGRKSSASNAGSLGERHGGSLRKLDAAPAGSRAGTWKK